MPDNDDSAWDQIPSLNLTMDDDYSERVKSKEGRRHPRSNLSTLKAVLYGDVPSIPVKIASVAHGVFDGLILDVSESGCRIIVPNVLKEGELTKIRFIIDQRTVLTKAVVRWVSPEEDGCSAGLEFREITGEIKQFLGTICSASMFNTMGKVT